ncbi:heme ABC transporter ATP-binding protein [Phaeodactylibacter luteus]|uniref:Heme ABC transporter ATP-binding protein n=1 Tax=Phaeodactylibacter luteus TaxID=1564516 RepID=A0A5C6S5F6_9BACT|nr:heme ABC transporter ATP-binding protein [Phaeodactylibacter luteus]TXB69507.1 heme ABC transporter ATP-binding protein [Phaeodactylibacter luteus]
MLEAIGVKVSLGGESVLRDVSLAALPGELGVVLGANGAGKSTLLRALSGELPLTAGSVLLHDRPVQGFKAVALAKYRAVLSQQFQVAYHMSVGEVAMLGRYPYTEPLRRSRELARKALKEVGLSSFWGRSVQTLSGGEQQRVHFARALLQLQGEGEHSRFLLLDEPTASLDLKWQHELLQLARHCAQERNIGVVAVLHDINLAARYADRVWLMQNGGVVASGPPGQSLSAEALSRAYRTNVQPVTHNSLSYLHFTVAERTAPLLIDQNSKNSNYVEANL